MSQVYHLFPLSNFNFTLIPNTGELNDIVNGPINRIQMELTSKAESSAVTIILYRSTPRGWKEKRLIGIAKGERKALSLFGG